MSEEDRRLARGEGRGRPGGGLGGTNRTSVSASSPIMTTTAAAAEREKERGHRSRRAGDELTRHYALREGTNDNNRRGVVSGSQGGSYGRSGAHASGQRREERTARGGRRRRTRQEEGGVPMTSVAKMHDDGVWGAVSIAGRQV